MQRIVETIRAESADLFLACGGIFFLVQSALVSAS